MTKKNQTAQKKARPLLLTMTMTKSVTEDSTTQGESTEKLNPGSNRQTGRAGPWVTAVCTPGAVGYPEHTQDRLMTLRVDAVRFHHIGSQHSHPREFCLDGDGPGADTYRLTWIPSVVDGRSAQLSMSPTRAPHRTCGILK